MHVCIHAWTFVLLYWETLIRGKFDEFEEST